MAECVYVARVTWRYSRTPLVRFVVHLYVVLQIHDKSIHRSLTDNVMYHRRSSQAQPPWNPWEHASPPTLENQGTKCIWSPPTFQRRLRLCRPWLSTFSSNSEVGVNDAHVAVLTPSCQFCKLTVFGQLVQL